MARRLRSRHYGGTGYVPDGGDATSALDASLAAVSADLTVAEWVKIPARMTGALEYILLALFNTDRSDGLIVSAYDDGTSAGSVLFARMRNGTQIYDASAGSFAKAIFNGSYHRVVATIVDATKTLALYMDGALVATGAAAWSGTFSATCKLSTKCLTLPSHIANHGDVTVDVGHAWSPTQVAADYYDATPPATYTHRWPLDDGAGSTARATRGGLALTLSGGAAFSADSPMIGRGVVRNFAPQGGRIDTSPWALSGATAPAYGGAVIAALPDGMRVLTDDATAGVVHKSTLSWPTDSAGRLTIFSTFVKYISGTGWIALGSIDGVIAVYFNAQTGAFGSASGAGLVGWQAELQSDGLTYRVSTLYKASGAGATALYLASASGVAVFNGTGGGNQIAVGGNQIEIAYPGQTTPSPYVPTGAAPLSVYGAREWRQNLLVGANDLTKWNDLFGATTPSASQLIENAGASEHYVHNLVTLPVGPVGFFAVVKPAGRTWIVLTLVENGSLVIRRAYINLAGAGTSGTLVGAGVTSAVRALPNGEYLCAMWFVNASQGTYANRGAFVALANADNSNSYSGDGVSGVNVRAAQVAQVASGTFPDFIGTTTAPANSSGAPRSQAL